MIFIGRVTVERMDPASSMRTSTNPPTLAEALTLMAWGPRDLARAVNFWLSARGRAQERINITAAYPWLRDNYYPHGSIPEVVATVLSDKLGYHVSPADLWLGNPRARRTAAPMAGLSFGANFDDVASSLRQLAAGVRPMTTSAPQLVAAVIDGIHREYGPLPAPTSPERVPAAQVELIADHVGALRRLDDRQGGGALSLRYVKNELASVLDLLTTASCAPEVGRELMLAVADLAQLTGWMQFDAGELAIARTYLLLAIRVANLVGDRSRVVNYGGLLSYAVATSGHGHAALQIVEALSSTKPPSRLLQARTAGRVATACASAGDLAGFRTAADNAQLLLSTAEEDETSPYLYYLSPEQLSAEAGHSLVTLAMGAQSSRSALLKDAINLLEPLSSISDTPDSQRSALLHGCALAKAHILRRDLEAAVAVTRVALTRLDEVQSGRCAGILRDLRRTFVQRKQARVVAEFLPDLDQALSLF